MEVILKLNLVKKLEKDDILVYADNAWVNISKDEYLAKLKKEIKSLKKDFEELKSDNDDFKNKVNEKLREYHNILQVLTKEN